MLGLKTTLRFKFLMTLFLILPAGVMAQEATDFEDVSLEDLLNTTVTVASNKAMTLQESPGIVTLITRDEIAHSGARDLMDALRYVPGLSFGVDVASVVGIGVRGQWAHEGKALLLINGLEMNEVRYATLQFGHHFPIDQIERIEIIRGPGSAIYGGFAELAVINVVTRGQANFNGVEVSSFYSRQKEGLGRAFLNVNLAKTITPRSGFDAGFFIGDGQRSDRVYTSIGGESFDMAGNSDIKPIFARANLSIKGLEARMIYDRYKLYNRQNDIHNLSQPIPRSFGSFMLLLTRPFKFKNDRLAVTPEFGFKRQAAWNQQDRVFEDELFFDDLKVDRYSGKLTLSYDPTPQLNVLTGGQFYYDHSATSDHYEELYPDYFDNGKRSISFTSVAALGQIIYQLPTANVTAGFRYDHHSDGGSAFVPRLSLTRKWLRWHAKLLASQAFRVPVLENIITPLGAAVRPEKMTVFEAELGARLRESLSLTGNIFWIRTKDPIIYRSVVTNPETGEGPSGYDNYGKTGSRGFELEARYRHKTQYATVTYSFYQAHSNEVADYVVPGHDRVYVGMPAHKLTLNGHYALTNHVSVNPAALWYSAQYAYTTLDEDTNPVIAKLAAYTLLNLNIMYHDFLRPGLTVCLGFYNLLDTDEPITEPYNGYYSPTPGPSREMSLKANWAVSF